jgi:hypothetical protein
LQHLQKHLKKQKMGLLNKDENWWLRLTIVIITLISLSTLSYYNRQVTQLTTKSTSDSTAFYKAKCDTLTLKVDTLMEENVFKENQIGLRDMIIGQAHEISPRMMNELLKNTEGLAYEK